MRVRTALFLLLALLPTLWGAAQTKDTEITNQCTIAVSEGKGATLTDGKGYAGWTASTPAGHVTITPPEGAPLTGLWLSFLQPPGAFRIETADGETVFEEINNECYIRFIPMPAAAQNAALTLHNDGVLAIGEVRAFSGPPGAGVRVLEPPADTCDILIIVAHPDDDILYFGGTVPVYAVNRGYRVQVVFMTAPSRRRVEEGMYGQWVLGNRHTPIFGDFVDKRTATLSAAQALWGAEATDAFIVAQIRRFRPTVVLTHDLKGEYGHGAHMLTANSVQTCVEKSGDPAFFPASAERYGTWNVAKCYLHLYKENPAVMDWEESVPALGGESALVIARRAFREHITQSSFGMDVRTTSRTSCIRFGLAYTQVGADAAKNDFMENVGENTRDALNPHLLPTPEPTPTDPLPQTPDAPAAADATGGDALVPVLAAALGAMLFAVMLFTIIRRRRVTR
jgi:LmbE family N-acetylglucosaminyl deacetylase